MSLLIELQEAHSVRGSRGIIVHRETPSEAVYKEKVYEVLGIRSPIPITKIPITYCFTYC